MEVLRWTVARHFRCRQPSIGCFCCLGVADRWWVVLGFFLQYWVQDKFYGICHKTMGFEFWPLSCLMAHPSSLSQHPLLIGNWARFPQTAYWLGCFPFNSLLVARTANSTTKDPIPNTFDRYTGWAALLEKSYSKKSSNLVFWKGLK